MKLIPLTQGQFAKVDDADFEWLSQWKWQAAWRPTSQSFYAERRFYTENESYTVSMAREILGLRHRDGKLADHKNGDTLNNQRYNLRSTDRRGNNSNKYYHRAGKLVGASFRKTENKWQSRVQVAGRQVSLGYFPTEIAAHEAYLKAIITA